METLIEKKLTDILDRTKTLSFTENDRLKIRGDVAEILLLLKTKAKALNC